MESVTFCCSLVVLAVALYSGVIADTLEQPIVDTRSGRLQGKTVRSKHFPGAVQAFLGIPYAQPPVGDLRWALPQPKTAWEGTRDATKFAAGCPQDEDVMRKVAREFWVPETGLSEDCLFLDVYTPDLKGKRDVLVMIHGGGHQLGKSSLLDGSAFVALGDIVVVSIGYRLGLLGFLQNFNGNWPSNLGIRDQQLALKWVRDNIAAFGGDPGKVTLSGESAGSMSVSLHVLAPSSRGLFNRAICQSGSVFSISSTSTFDMASIAIQMLGCDNLDADATLGCLRGKTAEEIVALNLPPVIMPDDEIMPKAQAEVYLAGDFPKVNMMIGITENEGFIFAEAAIPALLAEEIDVEQYKQQLGVLVGGMYGNNADKIYEEIIEYYFGGDLAGQDLDFIRRQTVVIVGSLILSAPTYLAAQYHADSGAKTFFYRFDYQLDLLRRIRPDWHSGGCDHGGDLVFTNGVPFMMDVFPNPFNITADDIQMATIAMQYWINFIKTGNPNGEGLLEWKPFTREKEEYLVLNVECEHASAYLPEDMSFWNVKLRGLDKPSESRDEL